MTARRFTAPLSIEVGRVLRAIASAKRRDIALHDLRRRWATAIRYEAVLALNRAIEVSDLESQRRGPEPEPAGRSRES